VRFCDDIWKRVFCFIVQQGRNIRVTWCENLITVIQLNPRVIILSFISQFIYIYRRPLIWTSILKDHWWTLMGYLLWPVNHNCKRYTLVVGLISIWVIYVGNKLSYVMQTCDWKMKLRLSQEYNQVLLWVFFKGWIYFFVYKFFSLVWLLSPSLMPWTISSSCSVGNWILMVSFN